MISVNKNGKNNEEQIDRNLTMYFRPRNFVEWDSFFEQTPMGQKPFHNLIATFDPLVSRRLVFACHYDSKIIQGFFLLLVISTLLLLSLKLLKYMLFLSRSVFLGATDSALPCALMLDAAKTLGPLLHERSEKVRQLPHILTPFFWHQFIANKK